MTSQCCSSIQSLSCVRLFATKRTAARQAFLSLTNSQSLLKYLPIKLVMPSNLYPLSSPSPLNFNLSQHQVLFKWVSSSHQVAKTGVSASTSVFPMNNKDWYPLGWTDWTSLQFRDSQESSPTPQFKSINSSALSFLYTPILTSIHDYWKNHSFD